VLHWLSLMPIASYLSIRTSTRQVHSFIEWFRVSVAVTGPCVHREKLVPWLILPRGFVTATDIQQVDAFHHHSSKCCRFSQPSLPDFSKQLAECNNQLFSKIRCNSQHILHCLLRPPSAVSQNYGLRRPHDRQLPPHASHLMDCEFITRISYKRT